MSKIDATRPFCICYDFNSHSIVKKTVATTGCTDCVHGTIGRGNRWQRILAAVSTYYYYDRISCPDNQGAARDVRKPTAYYQKTNKVAENMALFNAQIVNIFSIIPRANLG